LLLYIVKSRMQGLDAHKYRSTGHCISEILKNEGAMAFYKGVGPRLTRVCCEVGITMSIYGEIVKVVSCSCSCSFIIIVTLELC
jgi:solute carrier family 25 citrate transporter 1